jgi:diguanylate cyclase (GGDEF)-like protein
VELIGTINGDSKHMNYKLTGIAIDISKRKRVENKLKKEATTDPLTGILNRRKLEQIMQKQIILSNQNKDVFSFLMLDIDYFKKVNDSYGHPVGDKILIHIVSICKEYLRKNDYLARVGGEEFAILLPLTDINEAKLIANRIREKVENSPFLHKDKPIHCTISIGCITHNDQLTESSHIYKLADSALYDAKNSGRNLVCSL